MEGSARIRRELGARGSDNLSHVDNGEVGDLIGEPGRMPPHPTVILHPDSLPVHAP